MSVNDSLVEPLEPARTGWAVSIDEDTIRRVTLVFYVLVVALGVPGNGVSIYLLAANKKLRETVGSISTLLLSLSLIDFITCTMMVPTYIFRDVVFPKLNRPFWCRAIVSTYFFWALAATSAYHLTFISIDRYIAICHPVFHKLKWNRTRVCVGLISTAYFIGFVVSVWWIAVSYHIVGGECVFNTAFFENQWRRYEGWHQVGVDLVIPTAVMSTVYSRIYFHLAYRSKKSAAGKTLERGMKNVLRTMVVTGVTYFVCVSPNKIQWWLYCTGIYEYDFDNWPTFATHVLVSLNSCANPIIYTFSIESFKQELKKLLGFKGADSPVEATVTSG